MCFLKCLVHAPRLMISYYLVLIGGGLLFPQPGSAELSFTGSAGYLSRAALLLRGEPGLVPLWGWWPAGLLAWAPQGPSMGAGGGCPP